MKIIILLSLSFIFLFADEFKYRKYEHVKKFYEPIVTKTIELSLKHNMPPAAILAIASVESGYGRGYVARISGNILSLGTGKNETELPALYLPNVIEPYKIIYNPKEIKKHKRDELRYKTRAKSLKKDYRPSPYAGTQNNLEYFDENPKEKIIANLRCIEDFCTKWISYKNRYEPFKKARLDLDTRVKNSSKNALFNENVAIEFIHNIGGKNYSFNYRKTWAPKVIAVMRHTGLVQLTKDMKNGKSFKDSW